MRNLRPSGPNSFEEFIGNLLSKISGERIRRCKAGSQSGVDSLAEIPFAVEYKRYENQVRTRDVLGGLTEAAITHRDLQLWVLVATSEVGALTCKKLKDAGLSTGVSVLILDARSSEPLQGVPILAALAATDVDATLDILGDRGWRTRGRSPNLKAVRSELHKIRRMRAFGAWESDLREDLRSLPTWRHLVRSQNRRLLSLISRHAAAAFGTPYDPRCAVRRTAVAQLTDWVNSWVSGAAIEAAVVTGDRFDGKTWLVYGWLSENLRRLPLPVFFFGSDALQDERGNLDALIQREAKESLGQLGHHAEKMIERHRTADDRSPWCVVVIDGANEYAAGYSAVDRAMLWLRPVDVSPLRTDAPAGVAPDHPEDESKQEYRPCALLITCRTNEFDANASRWLQDMPFRRVCLEPYDDNEFAEALKLRRVTAEDLATMSESAASMIRHPLYVGLVIDFRDELNAFTSVTADVLQYLEARTKVLPGRNLDSDQFQAFLVRLAEDWNTQQRLNYAKLRKQVREVTESVDTSIAALISEGVITRAADDSFVPDPERLAFGMGLSIRERLISVADDQRHQALISILAPNPDNDKKLRWLRAAVTTSVLAGDDDQYPGVVECLLSAWLSSRNFSTLDLEDVRSLSPFLIAPLLRLASSSSTVSTGVLLIAEVMIDGEIKRSRKAIAAAVGKWFRFVPTDTFFNDDEKNAEEANRVRSAALDASLADLGLVVTLPDAGRSVRKRHRLGLSIARRYASLVDATDKFALVASRGVTVWNLDAGERFALRDLLEHVTASWFEAEAQRWNSKPKTLRATLLRDVVVYSDRADLESLAARLPAVEQWEWPKPLTREEVLVLHRSESGDAALKTATRAAGLVLDPECPRPPRAWRARFAAAAKARFGDIGRLHASRSRTKDDLDLERIDSALAAWAPEVGAAIMRSFLTDIPRRVSLGESTWSWAIDGNTALLINPEKKWLRELAMQRGHGDDPNLQHTWRQAYLCGMIGAAPRQRLELLLSHPFITLEWTVFYEVLAIAADKSLREETLKAVRAEQDPLRLKRARYLLAQLGGWRPSAADVSRLIEDLEGPQDNAHAAEALLRYSRIHTTTPSNKLQRLIHAAESLSDEAWQYEAFRDITRRTGLHGAEWVARARSAPLTARDRGSQFPDDDLAVTEGLGRLTKQLEKALAEPVFGHDEQFPEGLAAEISDDAFESWIEKLLSNRTRHRVSALIVPVLLRALRTRHRAAKELWKLAYPFQRGGVFSGDRFVVQGLDWTLVDIHDTALDDGLAREILKDLLLDCRSDSELVSVALGARIGSQSRLVAVVRELLEDEDQVARARASYVAGWMIGDAQLRRRLSQDDRSRWVARIAKRAIERLDLEAHAREWLRRFLGERRRAHRWAAGRLFLACRDAATPFWAYDVIQKSRKPASRRAEAVLLVRTIRNKVDDSELRDHFLMHSVRELSPVASPWHEPVQWQDIEITPDE